MNSQRRYFNKTNRELITKVELIPKDIQDDEPMLAQKASAEHLVDDDLNANLDQVDCISFP